MSTANELDARVRMMGAHPDMGQELSAYIESVRDSEPMAMYGYESNHSRLQPLTEATVDRIIQHGKDGMIILSADRVERSEAENYQKRHELLADIKAQGLSYIVVYGGYRDMQTDPPKTANGETSFVIPAHYRDGKPVEWSKMEQFAKEMCGKYDQDSVLIQPPAKARATSTRTGPTCSTSAVPWSRTTSARNTSRPSSSPSTTTSRTPTASSVSRSPRARKVTGSRRR